MPLADPSFGWSSALVAFAIIATAAFLVTWVVTDLLDVGRARYVAILSLVVATLAIGYVAWSGTSWAELIVEDWVVGALAGVVAGVVVIPLVRKLPSHTHPHGFAFGETLVWEALVYGVAEGLLLATLPTLAAWQAAADLGWTDGGWSRIGAGVFAIGASLSVILVHHLGYAEFRTRTAGVKLTGALVTCGLQAMAFLFTGNILAPIVAHIVLHTELLARGVELPPVEIEERAELRRAA